MFLGSAAFGLAVTNVVYLLFVILPEKQSRFANLDYDKSYYTLKTGYNGTGIGYVDENLFLTQVDVTNGMIALWTLGGFCNAVYDFTIEKVAACSCCVGGNRKRKDKGGTVAERLRTYLIVFLVLSVVTGSTLAVLVRAAHESYRENQEVADKLQIQFTPNAESYRFVLAYFVELAFSLLLWNPLVGFLLFTGALGCCGSCCCCCCPGRRRLLPAVLGGRNAEIRALKEAGALKQREKADEGVEVVASTLTSNSSSLDNV